MFKNGDDFSAFPGRGKVSKFQNGIENVNKMCDKGGEGFEDMIWNVMEARNSICQRFEFRFPGVTYVYNFSIALILISISGTTTQKFL